MLVKECQVKSHLEDLDDISEEEQIDLYKGLAYYRGRLVLKKGSVGKEDVDLLKEILRKVCRWRK